VQLIEYTPILPRFRFSFRDVAFCFCPGTLTAAFFSLFTLHPSNFTIAFKVGRYMGEVLLHTVAATSELPDYREAHRDVQEQVSCRQQIPRLVGT
jgi:hypothetical protein